jgi:hypothetical protein
MEIIRLVPHHVMAFWSVYYCGTSLENLHAYDARMTENEKRLVKLVINDPKQQVQIVSTWDSICEVCPYNPSAPNYDPDFPDPSHLRRNCYNNPDNPHEGDKHSAEDFNLTEIIDKDPISSSEFLERIDLLKRLSGYKCKFFLDIKESGILNL